MAKSSKAIAAVTAAKTDRVGAERIIYDNYSLGDGYEEAKQFLEEEYGKEPSKDDVWRELYDEDQANWEEETMRLEEFFEGRVFVCRGTVGRWNGPAACGAVIRGFRNLYPAWKDCDYLKLYDVDGQFLIQSTHHDGTNRYELRELTKRGLDYLELHEGCMPDRRLHEQLWKPGYSRRPNYAHLIFGCKRREAA